jgi:hypothetical protein
MPKLSNHQAAASLAASFPASITGTGDFPAPGRPASTQISQRTLNLSSMSPGCKEHLDTVWENLMAVTLRARLTPSSSPKSFQDSIAALQTLLTSLANLPDECRDEDGRVDKLKSMAQTAQVKLAEIAKNAGQKTKMSQDLNRIQIELEKIASGHGLRGQQINRPPPLEILGKSWFVMVAIFYVIGGAVGLQTR